MCLWAGSIRDFHHTGRHRPCSNFTRSLSDSHAITYTLTFFPRSYYRFFFSPCLSYTFTVLYSLFLTMSERVGLFRHRALLIQGQCNHKAKKLTNLVAFPTLKIVCVCAAASSIFIISRLLSNPCPLTVCWHAYRYIICRRGSFIYWFDPWLALNKGK
jgi:hypothetical protein